MNIVDRVKNIIISPKSEWAVIADETADTGSLIVSYAVPLAALSALAAFVGYGFIGIMGISGLSWGLVQGITVFITSIVSVYLTAMVVSALASNFDSVKDMGKATQLVVFSYTPAWIGGLLSVIPGLGVIGSLFGLYGLYLMYLGMPYLLETPQDKIVVYMIVVAVILIVVWMVVGLILTGILTSIFGLTYALGAL